VQQARGTTLGASARVEQRSVDIEQIAHSSTAAQVRWRRTVFALFTGDGSSVQWRLANLV